MARPEHIPQYPDSNLASEETRKRLTKVVMRLLSEWDLKTAEELKLLGLRETSRTMLSHYRNLENALPYDQDKLERAGLLLNIYKNIYALYPENESLRKTWIKRTNKMLDDKRPLDIMLDNGLFGMADIMRFLDLQMKEL